MVSRGAIKYQPFSALEGHKETIKEKENEIKHIQRPILSEDDCIRINDILIRVINENLECRISFYRNYKIITLDTKILKVLNGSLYLEDDKILISDIVDILI